MSALAAWAGAVPAIVAAVAVLLVPGAVALAPLRLGVIARIALGATVSIGLIGVSGVLSGLVGIPIALWQPLVLAVASAGLAFLVRRFAPQLRLPREHVRWWWLVASAVASAAVIAVVAFASVPDPGRISQTYDNVFHLAAIAHILDTGDASSLTLRTLIETGRSWSFYPSAWHTIAALTVQLTGAPVAVAVNAAWIAVCAAIWVPGTAWLAQVLLRRFEPGRVALVALPLAAASGAMPYALLTWGTLYPTFLATALLPVAVAVPVLTVTARATARSRRTALALGLAGTAIALAAVTFAQPRVLATWAVLVVPFVVARAGRWYGRQRRRRGRAARRATVALVLTCAAVGVVAASAFAYAVLRLGLFDRPLDDRLAGPQAMASQPVLAGLWQVLAQSWPTGGGGAVTAPALLLAVAVAVGIVFAVRRPGLRWVVVAFALLTVLYAFAAGSDDIATKLATALWYKDRYRLSSAIPVLGVALATLGILSASRLLRRRPRIAAAAPAAVAWIAAVSAAAVLITSGVSASVAFVFRMPPDRASSEVVSQAQIDFLRTLPAYVPEGQRVIGDPWDGSALALLYGDREPVFPHVNGLWDPDRALLALHLQDIETDPAVCVALDRLRVRYVLYDPHEFGGGDPSGNHFAGVHDAVERGLFTPVASDGVTALFRIDSCGPLAGAH